jgi:hypothetical protein
MPTNNNEWFEQNDILTYDEIVRLASILVRLGIEICHFVNIIPAR